MLDRIVSMIARAALLARPTHAQPLAGGATAARRTAPSSVRTVDLVTDGQLIEVKSRTNHHIELNAPRIEEHAPKLKLALEGIFSKSGLNLEGLQLSKLDTVADAGKAMADIASRIQDANLGVKQRADLQRSLVAAYKDFYVDAMAMSTEVAAKAANRITRALLKGPEAVTRLFSVIEKSPNAMEQAEEMLRLMNSTSMMEEARPVILN